MWAVVKADGTLLRSTGDVSGIIHPEAGFYKVNFNRNISSCAYSATIDEGLWGEISVWRYAPEDPSYSGEVAVVTRQSQGSSNYADAADKPFQLVVFC